MPIKNIKENNNVKEDDRVFLDSYTNLKKYNRENNPESPPEVYKNFIIIRCGKFHLAFYASPPMELGNCFPDFYSDDLENLARVIDLVHLCDGACYFTWH